jgi:hypothetical protein
MELIVATLAVGVVVGYLTGGRLSSLADLRVRWPAIAVLGLVLQSLPLTSLAWALALLYASFVLLLAFAVVNVRRRPAPFVAIALGVLLNFAVIGVNGGMPVTYEALVASGQLETLDALMDDGWVKHHLAGPDDRLLFLGDVLPIRALGQVMSVGDVSAYLGVAWLVVAGMRQRRRRGGGAPAAAAAAERST